ncbi:SET domain-containing protein 4 [Cladobotryum mycophilum]|uniref:SET domain-containing protein 4 n=1 Tax=Cladobotryum mycophilum TaxID=491253 RepID=A0ABR0T1R5_9HYPO
MTEKPVQLSTQAAVSSQANHAAPVGSTIHDHVTHKVEATEEEPYTIKCICNFSDDDGNTIYCETCDTWQHIDCFYPDNREEAIREDFAHSCAECKPRPLNRQKAIERTLQLKHSILETEPTDKKAKRPPSKSHKKKSKPSDVHVNGHHGPVDGGKHGNSTDHHHPSKKSKTSHRPSLSVSSQPPKRSPSYGNARSNPTHPPSPATTPPDLPDDFQIHHYSDGFCALYNELDVPDVHNNAFTSLAIPTALSQWLRDPSAMKSEAGRTYSEVFQEEPPNVYENLPKLEVEDATRSIEDDRTLRWRFIKSTSPIEKDMPLIELNGAIGFQKDYCTDTDNLWADLSSPLPFVFFHPALPLYIDTRREGSLARYVRRSCKPNAQLDTYLTDGSEYHFWLVSDRYISAHEQITLPWDFRLEKSVRARWLHLLGLSDDDCAVHDEFDLEESEYMAISNWVDRILSEYGGCACDLDNNCAFARFHRHYLFGKNQPRNVKRKQRKSRTHTISPTSTGHATNSRAASEGHVDDHGERDGKDDNASSRSKPPSRDRTPLRQGSFDQLGILTQPTDRDKRKVAMVEDSFRRMEQQQPPKKKKRVSDGTTTSTSSKSKSRNGSALAPGTYVDAGTSRSKSGSPASSRSPNLGNQAKSSSSSTGQESSASRSRQPSASPRPVYCDVGVQTDPVEGEWFSEPSKAHCPKKRIIPLSKRLLNNRHKVRAEEDRKRLSISSQASSGNVMEVDSPVAEENSNALKPVDEAPSPFSPAEDVPIPENSPADPPISATEKPATEKAAASSSAKTKTPDLRVETPTMPLLDPSGAAGSVATTPLSATSSVATSALSNGLPSPFSSVVNGAVANPSPIKKKLSLSDYTKSRLNKAATKTTLGSNPVKSSLAGSEDIKIEITTEPATVDKIDEVPSPLTTTAPTNGHL